MTATEIVKAQAWPKKGAVNDFLRHPPVEQYMTIDGLLGSHAAAADQKPLVCYPCEGVSDFKSYTGAEIDSYTNAAVQFYIENGLEPAVSWMERYERIRPNQRYRSHPLIKPQSWLSYLPATSRS